MKIKFLDFTRCGFGTLVIHSQHYKREMDVKRNEMKRFGIIVDKNFHEIDGRVVCFPVVHWEGNVTAFSWHPINITPYRKHNLEEIEISE